MSIPRGHRLPTTVAEPVYERQVSQTVRKKPNGPFAVGDVLACQYRIDEILGIGGMGVVYGGRDLALDRRVAIKCAKSPDWDLALRAEGRALAALSHPGVVTVHAVGSHDGEPFLVLERLVGHALDELLGEPRPLDEVLRMLESLATTLSAIHRMGFAHRDLKPGNVMLAGDRVVLFDFGLFVPEIELGREAFVGGTAPYVAPELVSGGIEPGSGALVDLYALGVLAFEMLVGMPPVLVGDGRSSPRVLLERRRPETPPELVDLVCELLHENPKERPASADVVLFHLAALRARRARVRSGELRVLIVDDDPALSKAFRRLLSNDASGPLAIEAELDPVRALERIDRDPPDIVLVDMQMPTMNGVELVMALRGLSARKRPCIVGMSSEASEPDVMVLRSLGVAAFLPKDAQFAAGFARVVAQLRQRA